MNREKQKMYSNFVKCCICMGEMSCTHRTSYTIKMGTTTEANIFISEIKLTQQ